MVSLLEKKSWKSFPRKRSRQKQKGKKLSIFFKQEDNPKVDKYQHVKDVYFDLL